MSERNFEPIYNVPTRQENRLKKIHGFRNEPYNFAENILDWVEELDRKQMQKIAVPKAEIPNYYPILFPPRIIVFI